MATDGGEVSLVCPDLDYRVSISCDTYDLLTGEAVDFDDAINFVDTEGPLLTLDFELFAPVFAVCEIICDDPLFGPSEVPSAAPSA